MIEKLRQLFSNHSGSAGSPTDGVADSDAVQLAAAALLVEVMVADHQVDDSEQQEIVHRLEKLFSLDKAQVDELFKEAKQACQDATSLYQFTRLINDHYGSTEKYRLAVSLWKVAFADGVQDKYEEGIIRRICELIYLSHSDFIRAKHQARQESSS